MKRFMITLHKSTTLLERRITLFNNPEVEAEAEEVEEVEEVVAVASICIHSSTLSLLLREE